MAGAEAAVQRVICERPKVSQRLIKGSKFLKWPKSDGDVSVDLIKFVQYKLLIFYFIFCNMFYI